MSENYMILMYSQLELLFAGRASNCFS